MDTFRRTLPPRLRAAGIHLAINVAIFLGTMYLLLVHWYPGFGFCTLAFTPAGELGCQSL